MKLTHYSKESIYSVFILSLLMLCGFYIRVGAWADYYYSGDDLWHLVMAKQNSVMDVIRANLREDVHPPLSYIILHFMLKISDSPYFLRCISLVPGMLLIPMTYLLGKERLGLAGATMMALLVTFGEWTTLLSSVIRAYSLMLVCITFALWSMYRFDKTQLARYAWGYFIAMFLAIELVHSVAFFIFATGSWWFLKNIRRKEMRPFLAWWVVGHTVLMACLLFYMRAVEYKVMPHYFPGAYYQGFKELFFFYSSRFLVFLLGNTSTSIGVIFILSFLLFIQIVGIAKKAWDIIYLFFSIFILLVVADYLVIFPFNDFFRGYIFWIIPIYLAIGAVLQRLFDKVLEKAREYEIPARGVLACAILMICAVTASLVIHARNEVFYRESYPSWYETSVPETAVHEALSFLENNVQPGDVIITSSEATWLMRYLFHPLAIMRHDSYVAETRLFSTPVYFDGRPSRIYNQYFYPHILQHFLTELQGRLDFSTVRKFWFVHFGWDTDEITKLVRYELIPPIKKYKCFWDKCEEYMHSFRMEDYALSWKFLLSPEVSPRFLYFNRAGAAVVYGVTPHFVEEALIKPQFINREEIFTTTVQGIINKRFKIKHE